MKLVVDFRMHKSSGIGTYISNIMPFLVRCFDVTLLGVRSDIEAYDFHEKVDVIECTSKIYSIKEQFELFFKIPHCDIFWSPHYNIPLLPIKAKKRMVTIHDVYHLAHPNDLKFAQRVYAKFVLGQAVRKSNLILTDSIFSSQEIEKYLHAKVSEIVWCAVDCKVFGISYSADALEKVMIKYGLPTDFLLYVGNVKTHKNLKTLLLAMKHISDVKLVIVGKEDGFINGDESIAQMIQYDEKLNGRVFFTGYVESHEIPIFYKLARLFVFPSLYEGFGLPPLEAQACGCPVVSSDAASLPEVCGDSVLYCDPNNDEDMAEKILHVMEDVQLQEELRRKGFENVKRFSWEESAKKVEAVIKRVGL